MPVIDHEISQLVIEKSGAVYGCWGRPESFAKTVRSLFSFPREYPFVMSNECRYDKSETDRKCNGCHLRGSGERYAQSVVTGAK